MIGKRPPLGVMPRYIWLELRRDDLARAIAEFAIAQITIPPEWVAEYNALLIEIERGRAG